MELFYRIFTMIDWADTLRFAARLSVELVVLFVLVSTIVYWLTDRLTPERLRRLLGARSAWRGVPLATLLGAVTPFCSCSTVPLASGLLRAGLPTSTLVAFLIASPLVSPVAIALLWRYVGLEYALGYAVAAMALAALGGLLLSGRTAVDEPQSGADSGCGDSCGSEAPTASVAPADGRGELGKLAGAFRHSLADLRKLAVSLTLAIVAGALVHDYVPDGVLARIGGVDSLLAIPAAALLGVPVYASVVVLLPIGAGLLSKGVGVGVVTTFLMASSGFSVPEGILLARILPRRLLFEMLAVFTVGVIGIGYCFQLLVA